MLNIILLSPFIALAACFVMIAVLAGASFKSEAETSAFTIRRRRRVVFRSVLRTMSPAPYPRTSRKAAA
jgi:hypothetical protein